HRNNILLKDIFQQKFSQSFTSDKGCFYGVLPSGGKVEPVVVLFTTDPAFHDKGTVTEQFGGDLKPIHIGKVHHIAIEGKGRPFRGIIVLVIPPGPSRTKSKVLTVSAVQGDVGLLPQPLDCRTVP